LVKEVLILINKGSKRNNMEDNNTEKRSSIPSVLGGVVVLVLVALGVWYISPRDYASPAADEPSAAGSETDASDADASLGATEGDKHASVEEAPTEGNVLAPNIPISPYTVYIGFAEEIGMSNSAFMGLEVGEAVIGYEWEALPGGQLFATVMLPKWSEEDEEYEVHVWNEETGSYDVLGTYPAGEEIEFPTEGFVGPSRFKVTGIDPALRICPGDRSFNWALRFTFEGRLGLVRIPITQELAPGETCQMRR